MGGMRTFAGRPRAAICAAALFSSISLAAAARPAVTLAAGGSASAGYGHSYVYRGEKKVSQLDWPLLPALSYGLAADLAFPGGFRIHADAKSALALPSGTMIDRDYLNPNETFQTWQSTHEGSVENGFDAELRLGWALDGEDADAIPRGMTVEPWLSFRYIANKWQASNGYTQYQGGIATEYAEWTDDLPKTDVYGVAIMYDQRFYVPSVGVTVNYALSPKWECEGSLGLSPFLYGTGFDNHLDPAKKIDYFDEMRSGIALGGKTRFAWYLSPAIALSRRLSERLALRASLAGTFINGLRGTTVLRYCGSGLIVAASDTAGADLNAGTLTLSLETTLD